MSTTSFSHEQILNAAQLSAADLNQINARRRDSNRLGFAYQLAFVRLNGRFPIQQPLEIIDDLLTGVSIQLAIAKDLIFEYQQRQPTLADHRRAIEAYTQLRRFGSTEMENLEKFLFFQASRLEQTAVLVTLAKRFLKESSIVLPADDTLRRIVVNQRQAAQTGIFSRVAKALSVDLRIKFDNLLVAGENRLTPFQSLKQPAGTPSPKSLLRLVDKLSLIKPTGILTVDLSWLNNNYQRSMRLYAQRCSADWLLALIPQRRYTVLACFLWQVYQDTIDQIVEMHCKLVSGIENRAQAEIDTQMKKQRRMIRQALSTFHTMATTVVDSTISDSDLRGVLLSQVDCETLVDQMEAVETWLSGKYSHRFHGVEQRFTYLRQFSPVVLEHLQFDSDAGESESIVEAIELLREMNENNQRKFQKSPPLAFVPKTLLPFMETSEGEIKKSAWESALMAGIRDELKSGNLSVKNSKRFGSFDDFFMPKNQWLSQRETFFKRASLPQNATEAGDYLTKRLNTAYDRFLGGLDSNSYAQVTDEGWKLSNDPAPTLLAETQQRRDELRTWLSDQLRHIKLAQLLIEVDNELHFTDSFMLPASQTRSAQAVCAILATIMAHGCNIGPYTMSRLTENLTYWQIKQVTDWQLTEEAQRLALGNLVNAILGLKVTQTWGEGKTSSSDGQRFGLKRRLLQQTYSHIFGDYALEFYAFIADNYAPFYITPIQCTDRDAPYVLDGLLYNESDLPLEEHYTDTHGYTEINFAAFAMLGRRFAPRIRGLAHQRIYRIDTGKDYRDLTPLVQSRDRTIHLDWITSQWDRMGQFYASLENGHTTASTALKRLASFAGKNQFYRANRELGRIFKTEYILKYLSDPQLRQRVRRGLLKGEQMPRLRRDSEQHALARQVAYGKQGQLSGRDWLSQKNSANCLTLILACISYWQAKEIHRIITQCDPQAAGVDLSLLEHISPLRWDNIILYGEYVLDPALVK